MPRTVQPFPGSLTILPDEMLVKRNTKNLLHIMKVSRRWTCRYRAHLVCDCCGEYIQGTPDEFTALMTPFRDYQDRLKAILAQREHIKAA